MQTTIANIVVILFSFLLMGCPPNGGQAGEGGGGDASSGFGDSEATDSSSGGGGTATPTTGTDNTPGTTTDEGVPTTGQASSDTTSGETTGGDSSSTGETTGDSTSTGDTGPMDIPSVCGDEIWADDEECDHGVELNHSHYGGGCDENCKNNPFCGDGKVYEMGEWFDEQCDDGNDVKDDGCDPDCTKNAT